MSSSVIEITTIISISINRDIPIKVKGQFLAILGVTLLVSVINFLMLGSKSYLNFQISSTIMYKNLRATFSEKHLLIISIVSSILFQIILVNTLFYVYLLNDVMLNLQQIFYFNILLMIAIVCSSQITRLLTQQDHNLLHSFFQIQWIIKIISPIIAAFLLTLNNEIFFGIFGILTNLLAAIKLSAF